MSVETYGPPTADEQYTIRCHSGLAQLAQISSEARRARRPLHNYGVLGATGTADDSPPFESRNTTRLNMVEPIAVAERTVGTPATFKETSRYWKCRVSTTFHEMP